MDLTELLILLAIGAVTGWLAGIIMKGSGFGLIGDIVIGIIGAVVGGYLFSTFGISAGEGILGAIITGTVGAVLLLFIISLIKRA